MTDHLSNHRVFTEARSVRLSAEAKASGRAHLERLMQERPLTTPTVLSRPTTSGWWFALRPAFSFALIVVMVFSSGVGVAWAAERSLPGETLYRVKVGVTEPLRTLLTTDPKAKAEWQAERITRRLDELTVLEQEKRLEAPEQAVIETQLQEHIEALENLREEESETEADEVREQVRAELRSHRSVEWHEEGEHFKVKIRKSESVSDLESQSSKEELPTLEDETSGSNQDTEGKGEGDEEQESSEAARIIQPNQTKGVSGSSSPSSKTRKADGTKVSTTASSSNSGPQSTGSSGGGGQSEEGDEGQVPETISEALARSKALAVVDGIVKEAKQSTKDGKPVWEVRIERVSDERVVKVLINALTGSVIDIDD